MSATLPKLARNAVALLAVMVSVAAWRAGATFAAGVAISGGLALLNLGAWAWIVRRLFDAVISGHRGGVSAGLFVGKLMLVGSAVVGLAAVFPPLSVVLGISVVVGGILACALGVAVSPLRAGEA